MITFKLDAVPEAGEAHQMPVFPLNIMWRLVPRASFEPLKKALGDDDAALSGLHGCPHATW